MEKNFFKGFSKAAIFYIIGALIVLISHQIFGPQYVHGPNGYHMLVFLIIFIGFIWALNNLKRLFNHRKIKYQLGSLACHTIIMFGTIGYILYILSNHKKDTPIYEESELDTLEMKVYGDTIEGRVKGNLVYFKVKDSILIDLIEPAKLERLKVIPIE